MFKSDRMHASPCPVAYITAATVGYSYYTVSKTLAYNIIKSLCFGSGDIVDPFILATGLEYLIYIVSSVRL